MLNPDSPAWPSRFAIQFFQCGNVLRIALRGCGRTLARFRGSFSFTGTFPAMLFWPAASRRLAAHLLPFQLPFCCFLGVQRLKLQSQVGEPGS